MNTKNNSEYTQHLSQRARQQLIGAVVLVVLAVILFSWIFGASPPVRTKPVVVEIPLDNAQQSTALTARNTLEKLPQEISFAKNPPDIIKTDSIPSVPITPDTSAAKTTGTEANKPQETINKTDVGTANQALQKDSVKKKESNLNEQQKLALDLLEGRNAEKPKSSEQALWVSVGVYANKDSAKKIIEKLEKKGFKVKQQSVEKAGSASMTRVMIGPFSDALETQGKLAVVRSIEPKAQILNN